MTTQDSQSDAEKIVNEILRRHDHQQDAHELDVSLIEAYVTTRVKEALEAARSKDPHKCEFGHEVYSHNTVDGWCCACEADQAFMDGRVKEAEQLARIEIDHFLNLYHQRAADDLEKYLNSSNEEKENWA